ncbi:MAG: 2-succinyl-5-enolpyruvyl-6-hydroxy-3-cyclohexene-1-carboxylic-acid synthase, partial [Cyclobacteriaceae bacterium]
PLYPAKGEQINYSTPHVITEKETIPALSPVEKEEIVSSLKKYTKVLIVAGHQEYNDGLHKVADRFSKKFHAPIIGDVISNFHGLENTIRYSELIVGKGNASILSSLQPELLITFGKSVISKSLKLYLRKHKAIEHWHIQPASRVPDPFQSVSKIIRTTPRQFFDELATDKLESGFASQKKGNYYSLWQAEEHRVQRLHENFFKQVDFHELGVIQQLMHALPMRCSLHLSNSMAVRYANLIGLTAQQKGVHVFANRGTSGIDGCTSTAVGNALVSDIPTILITGDMAFFYDRNAFWHNYPVPNLHVVVVNNHGGIIFGMIDGPSHLAEAEEYFITQQKLTAKNLADEFGFEFTLLDSGKKTKNALKDFFEFSSKTKILELHSDKKSAQEAYTQFNSQIKKGYDA